MSNGRTIRRKVSRSARGTKTVLGSAATRPYGWRRLAGQIGRRTKHRHYDTRTPAA